MERSFVEETPKTYQVRRHDTLYSIAWRFNLTVDALASMNAIRPPYTIYEGQQLRLTAGAVPPPQRVEHHADSAETSGTEARKTETDYCGTREARVAQAVSAQGRKDRAAAGRR